MSGLARAATCNITADSAPNEETTAQAIAERLDGRRDDHAGIGVAQVDAQAGKRQRRCARRGGSIWSKAMVSRLDGPRTPLSTVGGALIDMAEAAGRLVHCSGVAPSAGSKASKTAADHEFGLFEEDIRHRPHLAFEAHALAEQPRGAEGAAVAEFGKFERHGRDARQIVGQGLDGFVGPTRTPTRRPSPSSALRRSGIGSSRR